MDVGKIKWCSEQKKGIKLIKPNHNLANDYLNSAEETLLILKDLQGKSNIWLATTKYYCEYFTVYSLLMKIGIKCEIHDCTIEIVKILEEQNILTKGTAKILERDKNLRIDNQYYLKNKTVIVDYDKIRDMFLFVKNKINTITLDEINRVRLLLKPP